MFEKYLQDMGLSDKEAAIYVALLQVDSATASDIAAKTKIKRPTVYPVLEQLAKKGLISEVAGDKISKYQAEPPERLETYVEQQKLTLDERAKRLVDVIPQLKSIQRESGERPVIKYFEGKDGVFSSITTVWKSIGKKEEKTAYMIYSRDMVENLYDQEFRKKLKDSRLGADVKTKVVYTYSKGEYEDDTGNRVRIDGQKYPIDFDLGVIGDEIIINTAKNRVSSLYRKSKDIASSFISLINLIHDLKKEKGPDK
jgi:sugar-specific transcriptional regulator TrmB